MADVFTFPEEQFLLVGKITKPHGLKGEVKVFAYSGDSALLVQHPRTVLVDSDGRLSPERVVERSRVQGRLAILKLGGIDSRDEAQRLQGAGMLIYKVDLPAAEDDEYYWYRLYDLPVKTDEGRYLGCVDSIFSNGAQDIMIVRDGQSEYLIPLIDSVIKEQTEEGVVITPPPGLLEINAGEQE